MSGFHRRICNGIKTLAMLMMCAMGLYASQSVTHGQDAGPEAYLPGQTYWGRNQYIEYIAGNLPIIISAPHGGYLTPEEIPNRTWGGRGVDYRSQEYTREVVAIIHQLTGKYPHVIINRLHRKKLDANRDIEEAAQGNPWAEQAWYEFHQFIEAAKATVETQYGRGLYLDFHSNIYTELSIQMGLGLSATDLKRDDESLNATKYINRSHVRSLASQPGMYFPELLRGPTSLGGMMQSCGFDTVPSPINPHPGADHYYNGGYNTVRHSSRSGGQIDGTQVEAHSRILKDAVRSRYSHALAYAILDFIERHYGFNLTGTVDAAAPSLAGATYRTYLPMVSRPFDCRH